MHFTVSNSIKRAATVYVATCVDLGEDPLLQSVTRIVPDSRPRLFSRSGLIITDSAVVASADGGGFNSACYCSRSWALSS
jgi:hypothetical protein